MSEIKKLTTEELQQIKNIKQKYTNLALSLGEIELQKISIEKEKQSLIDIHSQLNEEEMTLAKNLTEKYGNGSINIDTGEITL